MSKDRTLPTQNRLLKINQLENLAHQTVDTMYQNGVPHLTEKEAKAIMQIEKYSKKIPSSWKKMRSELPPEGKDHIIIFTNNYDEYFIGYFEKFRKRRISDHSHDEFFHEDYFTHWMEINPLKSEENLSNKKEDLA